MQRSIPFQKVLEYILTCSFNHEVWFKLVENQENYLLCLGPRRVFHCLCLTAVGILLEDIVTTADLNTSSFTEF